VENNLSYEILIYNWLLPKENNLHVSFQSSFKNVTLSTLIYEINKTIICPGVTFKSDAILCHVVPESYVLGICPPMENLDFLRRKECLVLSHLCSENPDYYADNQYDFFVDELKRLNPKIKMDL
jgi:hypothetical protein